MSNLAAIDLGERELGVVTEAGSVRFERLLPGPIERVWAFLTEPEKRARWLAGGPLEQRPGGKVELRFRHADLSPVIEETPARYKSMEDGVTMIGEVLRCEPPHLLVMSWDGPPSKGSEVTFELEPRGDKVLLALTHRRLASPAGVLNVSGGWHTHLAILLDNLEGRTPRPFWSTHAKVEAEYARRQKAK